MSKPPKKKVVQTSKKKTSSTGKKPSQAGKKKVVTTSTSTRARAKVASATTTELVFGKQTYIWMGIGLLLIFVGLLLMTGGHQPGPDVWDDSIIYSFRRTVLAPIVIVAGLVVEIVAIMKK